VPSCATWGQPLVVRCGCGVACYERGGAWGCSAFRPVTAPIDAARSSALAGSPRFAFQLPLGGTVGGTREACLVEEYLAQHDVQPATIAKLRWLLEKAVVAFGDRQIGELCSPEIAAWRMTIPSGHRFEATQALRQVLARAVVWGMIDRNPAKHGVDNPQRRRTEKRPFESWAQLGDVADRLGARYGPMVLFAAATGLRPSEWIALERRDIDRQARVIYVRRAFRNGELKPTKTGDQPGP
jgi:integrase